MPFRKEPDYLGQEKPEIKLKTYVLNTEDKTIHLKLIHTKRLFIQSLNHPSK